MPKLARAGHDVRVLTRNPSAEGHVRGDLESGTGIAEAVAGMNAIDHSLPARQGQAGARRTGDQ